jgi:hypothetical protein
MTIARLMVNLSNLWCLKYDFPTEIAKLPEDYLKDWNKFRMHFIKFIKFI